jgi:hypothetical protein
MNYGKDCCLGRFTLQGGVWIDSPRAKFDILAKVRPTLYPDGTDCWIFEQDFHLRIHGDVYSILETFDYDGASIPRLVWPSIGHPMGVRKQVGAQFHDGFYASNLIGRHEADDLFLELLEAFEESWACRNKCWAAVRMCGGFVYPKTEAEKAKYRMLVTKTPLRKANGFLFAGSEPIEGLLGA